MTTEDKTPDSMFVDKDGKPVQSGRYGKSFVKKPEQPTPTRQPIPTNHQRKEEPLVEEYPCEEP